MSTTKRQFKVFGNYLHSPVESARTFSTKREAQEVNRKWTEDAKKQGMIWRGRAIEVK